MTAITALRPATFSSAAFARMARAGAFEDARYELRRGSLVRMSPQYLPHLTIKRLIARALTDAIERAGLPWLVETEGSVDFMEGFQPMPDIVVWRGAPDPMALDGPIPGGLVVLAVEVASGSLADDLGEKLEDYGTAGLAEYWVADVAGRLVLQHAGPKPGGYARREARRFGEVVTLSVEPGLTVPLPPL